MLIINKKGKFFLLVEYWLSNIEGILKLENDQLTTIIMKVNSDHNYWWMLNQKMEGKV